MCYNIKNRAISFSNSNVFKFKSHTFIMINYNKWGIFNQNQPNATYQCQNVKCLPLHGFIIWCQCTFYNLKTLNKAAISTKKKNVHKNKYFYTKNIYRSNMHKWWPTNKLTKIRIRQNKWSFLWIHTLFISLL